MKVSEFLSENFPFLVVKFSIYLNGRVFVMVMKQSKGLNGELKPEHKNPQMGPQIEFSIFAVHLAYEKTLPIADTG